MDAPELAEAIREALASKGQVSDIGTTGDRAQFSIATAVEGFEAVKEFEITVEERETASAP
jgi:hypothetical protein